MSFQFFRCLSGFLFMLLRFQFKAWFGILHSSIVITCPSSQWRNDEVAAASSDGGPTGGRGPPTVLEFLVINFSVCLVLLSNCYIIIYCIVWFQV